eukprot:5753877-Karenia_brevis.AAC.1
MSVPTSSSKPAKEPKQVRAMNESMRQIYSNDKELHKVIKPSTAHAYKKRDFPEFCVVKRKLDCCSKCR